MYPLPTSSGALEQYKVCILAAGKGHDLSEQHIVNPAVLPINKKGVISYIVEKFSKDVELVIAVGYKQETIKEYMRVAHPERKVTFVEIERYEGPGTGPGTSLLQCKEHLQSPFVLFTADTIVLEEIPPPTKNWLGIAQVRETEPYATVRVENGLVKEMIDKKKTEYRLAYVGVAGIAEYETFWNGLENYRSKTGEVQVTAGFVPFIEGNGLHAQFFTWFDTGTREHLQAAVEYFSKDGDAFDFGKMDEFIYFVGDRVVKYYEKQDIVEKKIHRATTTLKNVTPKILDRTNNFFAYKRVDGTTLYPVINDQVCEELVSWAHAHLWKQVELSEEEREKFVQSCKSFYNAKTLSRLQMFYDRTGIVDNDIIINDEMVPKLSTLLDKIDWEWLCDGLAGTFHGDCNFGNLIITNSEKGSKNRFVVIDWRQELGGLVDYGDIYYDLAKLYGGMTIHFELIRQNHFSYKNEGGRVYLDFHVTNNVLSAKKVFIDFVQEKGYDLDKIRILTAITFLNMAPLHHDPYNRMLYYFGRLQLHKLLRIHERKLHTPVLRT